MLFQVTQAFCVERMSIRMYIHKDERTAHSLKWEKLCLYLNRLLKKSRLGFDTPKGKLRFP